jgi:hypothetical protein
MGKNAAGYGIRKHLPEGFGFTVGFKLADIGHFAPAVNLQAVVGKRIEKARKGQARAVKVGYTDFSGQAFAPAYTAEVEGIMFLQIQVHEVKNSETLFRHVYIIIKRTCLGNRAGSKLEQYNFLSVALA